MSHRKSHLQLRHNLDLTILRCRKTKITRMKQVQAHKHAFLISPKKCRHMVFICCEPPAREGGGGGKRWFPSRELNATPAGCAT